MALSIPHHAIRCLALLSILFLLAPVANGQEIFWDRFERVPGDTASTRDVVINEVNWFGNGDDFDDEWIELRNISGSDISLTGWSIDAAGVSDSAIVIPSTVLGAGEYLVLGTFQGDDAAGERTSLTGVPRVRIIELGLSDLGEQLVLRDVEGNLIDSTPPGAWPEGNSGALYSMERIDDISGSGYADGSQSDSWYTWNPDAGTDTTHPDTMDSGTPGAPNSDPNAR